MAVITLFKPTYDKNQYQKVIDTSFTQLGLPTPTSSLVAPTISVAEFFQNYQELFFSIPKFGNADSHEYLIRTSTDYIGTSAITDTTVQALIDEITQLRQENLDLQQQLLSGSLKV
jgi:hypothetical protein